MKNSVFFGVALFMALWLSAGASVSSPFSDSAFTHIQEQMDKYHRTFDIYTDMDAGGNHFIPSQWMQEPTGKTAISLTPACTVGAHSGITCIQATFYADSAVWAAVGWVDSLGYDLTGADTCSFWAKGAQGGERITFEVGGYTGDSIYRSLSVILTNTWQQYFISLSGGNLSRVHRGFCWAAAKALNPGGCTFYLDDIQFDQARLDSARLVHTFVPLYYPHDREWALNQAYTYPNALAMLAFLCRGTLGDVQRARLIGDAFVFAQDNDRYYTDGRLRNAYRAGDLKDHISGKALLPGWWSADSLRWTEDEYQVGTYTGEMAWTILAWLTYDSITLTNRYLGNAITLGNWIETNCYDSSGIYPGYRGGFQGEEPNPAKLGWKATEHNLDLYAAFSRLYKATGSAIWQTRADKALNFVHSMWDAAAGCFRCGAKDSVTQDSLIVLDGQAWGLLATRDNRYNTGLDAAEEYCRRDTLGYHGFCFSERGDGIWWEGTAQMSCAYRSIKNDVKADTFLAELQRWQLLAPWGNEKGIAATCPDSSYTGGDRYWGRWYYFARLDITATSWCIFAENRYNPFWNDTIPSGVAGREENILYAPQLTIQIQPNPCRTASRITYKLPIAAMITVKVYNVAGQLVSTLIDRKEDAGIHQIQWNGRDNRNRRISNGIYLISLSAGKEKKMAKVLLIH